MESDKEDSSNSDDSSCDISDNSSSDEFIDEERNEDITAILRPTRAGRVPVLSRKMLD